MSVKLSQFFCQTQSVLVRFSLPETDHTRQKRTKFLPTEGGAKERPRLT